MSKPTLVGGHLPLKSSTDNSHQAFKAAAIRTVLRLVDGLASYVVALVAVLVTPERQRLGDMAAHTLVVHK